MAIPDRLVETGAGELSDKENLDPGHFYAACVFDNAGDRRRDVAVLIDQANQLGHPVRYWWLSEAMAEQTPTAEVGAQAATTEATTEAPTTEAATAAPTVAAATEAPTTAAGAAQAPTTAAATPESTVAPSAGLTSTTPSATAVSTPSTLPTTGGSDDGTAALGLIVLALGVLLLLGALGLSFARRPR